MNGEAPLISILLLAISPLLISIHKIKALQPLINLLAISPLLISIHHKIKALQPLINYKPGLIQVGLITLFVGIAVGIAVIRSGLFGQESYY